MVLTETFINKKLNDKYKNTPHHSFLMAEQGAYLGRGVEYHYDDYTRIMEENKRRLEYKNKTPPKFKIGQEVRVPTYKFNTIVLHSDAIIKNYKNGRYDCYIPSHKIVRSVEEKYIKNKK